MHCGRYNSTHGFGTIKFEHCILITISTPTTQSLPTSNPSSPLYKVSLSGMWLTHSHTTFFFSWNFPHPTPETPMVIDFLGGSSVSHIGSQQPHAYLLCNHCTDRLNDIRHNINLNLFAPEIASFHHSKHSIRLLKSWNGESSLFRSKQIV